MSIDSTHKKNNNAVPEPKPLMALTKNPSPVEVVKDKSDYLRGSIGDGLADEITNAITESDQNLIKFHGIYQQDNRDNRQSRTARKLEPDYSFMIRLRVPSGLLSSAQWRAVDQAATELTEAGSIRLTTRQTLQFHGIPKQNLRALLQSCAKQMLDSIAACGDVNRNVMCSPHAGLSAAHADAHEAAATISRELLPNTRAYFEIWLGEEKLAATPQFKPIEPLYGKHYLPRKFKIAVAVPPANDVDVYSQDIGFIAVVKNGKLRGFNIVVGGGLGMTHGDRATYPRLAEELGFCAPSQAAQVAWHIATIQRDYGDRSNRKQARFKYTVARLGVDFIRQEVMNRAGFVLPPCEEIKWTHRADYLGWRQQPNGRWDLGLFIENGRISEGVFKDALREVAALDCCHFLMTPNQNIMLINIEEKHRMRVESVFNRRHLAVDFSSLSGIRQNAMACVAFPTCPLAVAESERYLPSLITKIEEVLVNHNLHRDAISIRMTGCPNGCARPYLGEIGLVGKSPGKYNLYLGACASGKRLSSLAGESLNEEGIMAKLSPLFAQYAAEREEGEAFGDFLIRANITQAPSNAADFHP